MLARLVAYESYYEVQTYVYEEQHETRYIARSDVRVCNVARL